MKKTLQTVCLSLVLLLATGLPLPQAQAQQAQQTASTSVASLEGTTWSGTDSDGDSYTFTFLKDGHLRYTSQTAGEAAVSYEDEGDLWAQNGEIVIILLSEYSTYLGTIKGDLMQGKSWNVVEKRWSWEFKKK
jgi:hypothetical protein